MPKAEPGGWGENKTERISALVTPTAKSNLEERAKLEGVALGELLERIARGQIPVGMLPEVQKRLLGELLAS
jgi:hypothetical protein